MERVNRQLLRQLREANGYTQEEMSRLADLSLRRYVVLETKRDTNPKLSTLNAIASALRVKVCAILIED